MSAAAMAAISASSAATSSAAASRAKTEACKITTSQFDNLTATTQGKQAYADCIEHLFPSPMAASQVFAIKLCIVIVFAALLVGLFRGFREEGLGFDMLMTALGHVLAALTGIVAIGLVVAGAAFLITA